MNASRHGYVSKFGLWALFTLNVSPFPVSVSGVVGRGSKPEMIHADAGRVVAMVKNHHADRNRAMRQRPCEAMRTGVFSRIQGMRAVSIPVYRTSPHPTSVGLINFRPESLLRGDSDKASTVRIMRHREPILSGVMGQDVSASLPLYCTSKAVQ